MQTIEQRLGVKLEEAQNLPYQELKDRVECSRNYLEMQPFNLEQQVDLGINEILCNDEWNLFNRIEKVGGSDASKAEKLLWRESDYYTNLYCGQLIRNHSEHPWIRFFGQYGIAKRSPLLFRIDTKENFHTERLQIPIFGNISQMIDGVISHAYDQINYNTQKDSSLRSYSKSLGVVLYKYRKEKSKRNGAGCFTLCTTKRYLNSVTLNIKGTNKEFTIAIEKLENKNLLHRYIHKLDGDDSALVQVTDFTLDCSSVKLTKENRAKFPEVTVCSTYRYIDQFEGEDPFKHRDPYDCRYIQGRTCPNDDCEVIVSSSKSCIGNSTTEEVEDDILDEITRLYELFLSDATSYKEKKEALHQRMQNGDKSADKLYSFATRIIDHLDRVTEEVAYANLNQKYKTANKPTT